MGSLDEIFTLSKTLAMAAKALGGVDMRLEISNPFIN
jgi:hypothetical protein